MCVCLLLCGCVGVTHTSIQTDKTIDDDKDKNTHKDQIKSAKKRKWKSASFAGFLDKYAGPQSSCKYSV